MIHTFLHRDQGRKEKMKPEWYALRVKPHKEHTVYKLLRSRDVDVFLPLVNVIPVNPRSAKVRPYFPGYMFVYADLKELGNNALSWIPGTHGLVNFGGDPTPVPKVLIEQLQQRLSEIELAGGIALEGLEQGNRVRIISGPLAGYEGIFDIRLEGKDRVQILLAFMSNHLQRVKIDIHQIERIKE